jgi:hypothetical protein
VDKPNPDPDGCKDNESRKATRGQQTLRHSRDASLLSVLVPELIRLGLGTRFEAPMI